MVEQRKFKMHDKLLLDVIMRQAGSLQKAVLEGAMNSIEAGATSVAIQITPSTVTIEDDGKGFQNRNEVEKFFETFGQPHEASEGKVWAQFRMGRGQMFAFGKNEWRTGKFTMKVDIKSILGYDLQEDCEDLKGCQIKIALYDKLTDRDIYATSREIETFCKYVNVPIIVNGKQVNKDPSTLKWDSISTKDAYIRLSETANALEVYNLGVFVCALPKYTYSIGGTIVSKERLDVNFARNDVIKSCTVWKRIAQVIDSEAGVERIKKKRTLTPDERLNVIGRLCAGELDHSYMYSAPLFVDVSGNAWSANKISKEFKTWSFAKSGNVKGDKLIQSRLAIVLDEEIVRAFDCKPEELFSQKWKTQKGWENSLSYNVKYADFDSLSSEINDSRVVLPMSQLTPTEATWIKLLESIIIDLGHDRVVRIGLSEVSQAWTDGNNYVAFAREFLGSKKLKENDRPHLSSLIQVVNVLAHELAHDDDSTTNVHGAEFYKKFHDIVLGEPQREGSVEIYRYSVAQSIQRTYNSMQGDKMDKIENMAKKKIVKVAKETPTLVMALNSSSL